MSTKIFLDIETLPPDEAERDFYFAEYENFTQKSAFKENLPTFDDYFRNLALDAATGRLLAIGLIIEKNGAVVQRGCLGRDFATRKFHLDERRTLKSFWKLLCGFAPERDVLVGHNLIDFDLLFLLRRSAICGVMPSIPCARLDKYKTAFVFDTLWEWTGRQRRIGLERIARGMNLTNPKTTEIDGGKIYEAFLAGRDEEIAAYCLRDTECTREIYYRMNFAVPPQLKIVPRILSSESEIQQTALVC